MKYLIILITVLLFGNEVYFLPMNGKKAENRLFYSLTHAHNSIKIIMYAFTNKKIAKALKIAAAKHVKVTVIADKEEAKYKRSVIPNLATIKNINVYLLHGKSYKHKGYGKLHAKVAIIDNHLLVTGSANYTYSAFFKNYEYIIFHKDKNLIKKFNNFFNYLKSKATPYRLSR